MGAESRTDSVGNTARTVGLYLLSCKIFFFQFSFSNALNDSLFFFSSKILHVTNSDTVKTGHEEGTC